MVRHEHLLNPAKTLLMVIDLQEAFVGHVPEMEAIVERSRILIEGAKLLGVPIVATEQYPQGLGTTVEPIVKALGEVPRRAKTAFSCIRDDEVGRHLLSSGRKQVLLAGVETHVCVVQTALDSIASGSQPFVCADAVGSRKAIDHEVGLSRLRQHGAVVTTVEGALMEMAQCREHPVFKQISQLIK